MKTLHEIGLVFGTDKAKHHNFCNFYENHLNQIRNERLNILEIGIYNGASLKMWKEYFVNSNIYGVDILDKKEYTEERVIIEKCDQSNKTQLSDVFEDIDFDIIIDDGSHMIDHQIITLLVMFKRLKNNGIYILEDLHTSNRPCYRRNDTFENSTLKSLINFKETGNFNSKHATINECEYISNHIETLDIFSDDNNILSTKSITSIIKKK